MVASLLAAASLAGSNAATAAVASDLTTYTDDQDLFSIGVPAGWTFAVPAEKYDRFRAGVSSRRVLTWFPESGTDVNISIVITTPGADYTSLASFGSAADWGYNLVQSMDRSFMARRSKEEPPMVATLVKTESVGGTYVTEYTSKAKGEEQKHLISKVAMGSNGRLRRFFTVTAIFPEAKAAEVQKLLRSCIDTFTYTSESA